MQKLGCVVLALALFTGCGEPPVPTGPAAEASIDDIQITMEPTTIAVTAAEASK